MKTIVLEVDDDDEKSIQHAIAKWQREQRDDGGVLLADGEGNLAGRIIGEICRSWEEYHDSWEPPIDHRDDGEEWKR